MTARRGSILDGSKCKSVRRHPRSTRLAWIGRPFPTKGTEPFCPRFPLSCLVEDWQVLRGSLRRLQRHLETMALTTPEAVELRQAYQPVLSEAVTLAGSVVCSTYQLRGYS